MSGTRSFVIFYGPAVSGREDEFNAWYDDTHVPELFDLVGGIEAVRRFRDSTPPSGQAFYYNLFEVGDADPHAVVDEINELASAGRIAGSDAMAPGWQVAVLESMGDRRVRPVDPAD